MKTHFKKAFNSPYLSSADITGPTILTIAKVQFEQNRAGKKDEFHNVAHFKENEIRPGEELKPMILNVTNCKTLKQITDSPFIDDWQDVPVSIYVDPSVRFGRDMVEGLRISTKQPVIEPPATDEQLVIISGLRKSMSKETISWLDSNTPNQKQAARLIKKLKAEK